MAAGSQVEAVDAGGQAAAETGDPQDVGAGGQAAPDQDAQADRDARELLFELKNQAALPEQTGLTPAGAGPPAGEERATTVPPLAHAWSGAESEEEPSDKAANLGPAPGPPPPDPPAPPEQPDGRQAEIDAGQVQLDFEQLIQALGFDAAPYTAVDPALRIPPQPPPVNVPAAAGGAPGLPLGRRLTVKRAADMITSQFLSDNPPVALIGEVHTLSSHPDAEAQIIRLVSADMADAGLPPPTIAYELDTPLRPIVDAFNADPSATGADLWDALCAGACQSPSNVSATTVAQQRLRVVTIGDVVKEVGTTLVAVDTPFVWKFAEREGPMAQAIEAIPGRVFFVGGADHVGFPSAENPRRLPGDPEYVTQRVTDWYPTSLPEALAHMAPGFRLDPVRRSAAAIPIVLDDPAWVDTEDRYERGSVVWVVLTPETR